MLIRVGKILKMLPSFSPQKLRIFEGYSHQILKPRCCPHSHLDNWKFPKATLILKSSRSLRMNLRILENSQVCLQDYFVQGQLQAGCGGCICSTRTKTLIYDLHLLYWIPDCMVQEVLRHPQIHNPYFWSWFFCTSWFESVTPPLR